MVYLVPTLHPPQASIFGRPKSALWFSNHHNSSTTWGGTLGFLPRLLCALLLIFPDGHFSGGYGVKNTRDHDFLGWFFSLTLPMYTVGFDVSSLCVCVYAMLCSMSMYTVWCAMQYILWTCYVCILWCLMQLGGPLWCMLPMWGTTLSWTCCWTQGWILPGALTMGSRHSWWLLDAEMSLSATSCCMYVCVCTHNCLSPSQPCWNAACTYVYYTYCVCTVCADHNPWLLLVSWPYHKKCH